MKTNKEIELRAEVSPKELNDIENKFSKSSLVSSSERLSVIFLGTINNKNIDIRIRIDSQKHAELILKVGDFHSHNRIETIQKIQPGQFMGLVHIFSELGFSIKVMRRKTKRLFYKNEGYEVALVDANKIAYVEIEKVLDTNDEALINQEKNNLEKVMLSAGMAPINKEQFDDLCDRLTKEVDWVFNGSSADYLKLESELSDFL